MVPSSSVALAVMPTSVPAGAASETSLDPTLSSTGDDTSNSSKSVMTTVNSDDVELPSSEVEVTASVHEFSVS